MRCEDSEGMITNRIKKTEDPLCSKRVFLCSKTAIFPRFTEASLVICTVFKTKNQSHVQDAG